MRRHGLPLAAMILLAACSGSGSSGGGGTVVTPSPTPTATPAPTPSPTPSPTPTGTATGPDNYPGAASLYLTLPSAQNCVAGELKPAVTAQLLDDLNNLRALHNLPPVGYSKADEGPAQAAALMMVANNQLNHNPPSNWKCYTSIGADAAGSSNLFGGSASTSLALRSDDYILGGWMTEINNIVANNVGHRRWLLNPFATTVGYGRAIILRDANTVGDAAALRVFNTSGSAPPPTQALPDFVAYPYGDYPARYFDPGALLSFSVIADKTSLWANQNVNFSGATISVKHSGSSMTVSDISYDNEGYGVPNNLQFKVAGLQNNVSYDVAIANVVVNGNAKSYSYSFKIIP